MRDERGFTLIEILIALLIGLFLLGALLTIVQTNRAVFGNQNKLAQLQDGERMALTMMTDVIQSAGYFPDPTTNTLDQYAHRRRTVRAGRGGQRHLLCGPSRRSDLDSLHDRRRRRHP